MTPKEHNEWALKQDRMSFYGFQPLYIPKVLFYKIIELGEYDKWKNTFIVSENKIIIK
jgi:hypothetical protein